MTEELGNLLPEFQGDYSYTRCFLHILNLVAKAMLKQFNIAEVKDPETLVDDDVRELAELAEELAEEERATAGELQQEEGENAGELEDDEDWVDEVETLEGEEREEFERNIRPIKKVLVKVSSAVRCSKTVRTHPEATGTQDHLQDHTLHHKVVACLAEDP